VRIVTSDRAADQRRNRTAECRQLLGCLETVQMELGHPDLARAEDCQRNLVGGAGYGCGAGSGQKESARNRFPARGDPNLAQVSS
jgi:hypothetical protein